MVREKVLTDRRNTTLNRLLYKNRAVLRDSPNIVLCTPNRVNLNAWFVPGSTHSNIGDFLSLIVVEETCKMKGIDFCAKVGGARHLYAIGSILLGYQDATIWGSGFGYDKPRKWYSFAYNWLHQHYHRTDIRAVRGPLTRRILTQMGIACPEIYGDPAVLMPLFYSGKSHAIKREYVLIPHYSKFEKYKDDPNVLNTFCRDYRQFIDSLLEAKLVISSSLHGVILAESYGIPAIMLCDTPSADITKYKDWYYATGRSTFPVAGSVEHALELGGTPIDYRVIEQMQKELFETFPTDLWN